MMTATARRVADAKLRTRLALRHVPPARVEQVVVAVHQAQLAAAHAADPRATFTAVLEPLLAGCGLDSHLAALVRAEAAADIGSVLVLP